MNKEKSKTFARQDNLYGFPYHYLPQKINDKVIKPFRIHHWLYNYVILIDFLIKKIKENNHDKFLDFGCGDGRFINDFKKETKSDLTGYEISELASLLFKALNPNTK